MDVLRRVAVLLVAAGCAPTLEDPGSRVTSRRVLAVRVEPAEAAPGEPVRVVALIADPRAGAMGAAPRWSWCDARRPLSELGPAAPRCLEEGPWQRSIGEGERVEGALPMDACQRFGPDPPDVGQGESARPTDPDGTGGYSVPLRVSVEGAASLGFARVLCGLAGVTREQSVEWVRRYRRNENPSIEAVERIEGGAAAVVAEAITARPGARVTLRLRWPECPAEGSCAGAERYLAFDPVTRALTERREAMRVSWYVSDGSFGEVRTGRGRDEAARDSVNVFTAPTAPGAVTVWLVLRDERGGVDWRALRVTVGG